MVKRLRRAVKEINRRQNGQVLIMMLIVLALGGIVLAPTLNHAATSIKHQQLIETDALELYAADSGIDYALFKLSNGETDIGDYPLNGKTVSVNITGPDEEGNYLITSTAITSPGGSSTTIESYIESIPGGELDIFDGALSSKGDIWLKLPATVSGDMYIGGTMKPADFEPTDGEVIPVATDNFPTQADDYEFAQTLKDEALLGGTSLVSLHISSDTPFGPLYIDGDLYIDGVVTVNLTGIVYVQDNITVKKDVTIIGTGSLIAEDGDISIEKLPEFETDGDSIIMSLYGNIDFKKEGIIEALIYAPIGKIDFWKDTIVIGGVVGAEIEASKDGSFTYVPATSDIDYPGSLPASLNVRSYTIN